jgi:hypothetical protein
MGEEGIPLIFTTGGTIYRACPSNEAFVLESPGGSIPSFAHMKSTSDSVGQFLSLHAKLVKEQSDIVSRLNKISKVLGGPALTAAVSGAAAVKKKVFSAETRKRMAVAQKARWAKARGAGAAKPAKKATRKISAEGRARIAAAQKARWAKIKAAKAK